MPKTVPLRIAWEWLDEIQDEMDLFFEEAYAEKSESAAQMRMGARMVIEKMIQRLDDAER